MTSGNDSDPAWIRFADRCYGAGLSLFSPTHRREYGDLMRQAFRDRCREVARGERSAWRSFVLELTPDLVSNIGRENMNSIFGDMRPRQMMLLALLSLSSAYYLFGEAMGLRLSDLAVTLTQAANRIGREREAEALRTPLHRVAEPLAAGPTSQSKALAALMYRLTDLTTGWISRNEDSPDSATANALTRTVLAGPTDAHLLALSARLCMPMRGCDLDGITRRMLQLTPDNGYAWALEYKLGVLAKNPVRMRRALGGLASARYYDAHEGHVASEVLKEVVRLAPNDAQTLDTVAGALAGSGWMSVRLGTFCDPADASIPRFELTAEQIESAREDCVRAGRVMAASTQLDTALRGEQIVQALSDSPAERAAAQAHGLELDWLGRQLRLVDENHDWMYSYRPRVDMLLATFRAGEGEIPSARRWVSGRGIPAFNPN